MEGLLYLRLGILEHRAVFYSWGNSVDIGNTYYLPLAFIVTIIFAFS